MIWISKLPPIYVWSDDFWYCEKDGHTYNPNIAEKRWEHYIGAILNVWYEFPKKTVIMG